jgi:hypothetical protein
MRASLVHYPVRLVLVPMVQVNVAGQQVRDLSNGNGQPRLTCLEALTARERHT